MWRYAQWHKNNLFQFKTLGGSACKSQMTQVHRIEGTTENADHNERLMTNLAISQYDIFYRGQTLKTDWPACMKFVC